MGDLKLKKEVGVSYDSEKFLYTFQNVDTNKMKKVFSRSFPCLLGKNKYESIGKTILERYGAIEKEQIDPYYLTRGDLAEKLVYDYLKSFYQEKLKIELTLNTWEKKDINFDNFGRNEKFGGMIDIAISKPKDFRAVVEVKSKSMKDLETIKESKGNEEEVMQGLFLSYLSKVDKCLMAYVFFTPEQEQEIKKGNLNFTYKDVTILMFKHMVDFPKMDTLTKVAYSTVSLFAKNISIASEYFSTSENQYLQSFVNGGLDLPF